MNSLFQLPLYKNKGHFCTEYSLKGILDFLEEEYSIEDIISGIGREQDKLVYPVEIIPFLHKQKVPFQYPFIKSEFEETLEIGIEEKMKKFYGYNRGKKMFSVSNPKGILKSMEYVLEQDLGINKQLTPEELEEALKNGKVPLLAVNINILQRKPNQLKGHYIYLSGFDDKHFYYHDTGPATYGKNHKIRKEYLSQLLKLTWQDHSTILIG